MSALFRAAAEALECLFRLQAQALEAGNTRDQAGHYYRLCLLQFSGIWYTKAAVCDRNHADRNRPMKVFPMTVTALEGEDLEVQITFW